MWAIEKDHLGADDWLKGAGIQNENLYGKLFATAPFFGVDDRRDRDEDQNDHRYYGRNADYD